MKLPTFETKRLILREVTLADVPSYQKNFATYEVIQHLSKFVPWPFPKNGVQEFLEQKIFPILGEKHWLWVICEKENPQEAIGGVGLWTDGKPEHRGFWLAHQHWGKGYMTEAVDPVTKYAFEELGFEKLIFANAVGNHRSSRVKEKLGAVLIEKRPGQFVNPKYTETEVWELTKEAWLRNRNSETQSNPM